MKLFILSTLFLVFLGSKTALGLDVKERDKQQHIVVSTAISSIVKSYTGRSDIAFGTCLAIGTAKELYDEAQEGNKFDEEDMLANLIGCGIGIPIGKLGNNLFFNGRTLGWEWKF